MIPGFKWREPEDESDRKMIDDVRQFGWHVVGILGDDEGPPYSFSVGLHLTFGHPEIVVMGMDHETAQATINRIGERIQSGHLFVPERRYENLVEGCDVIFRPVSPQRYEDFLGYGLWFYKSLPKRFPAFQLIWPDKDGRFPWEKDHDREFFSLQQELWKDA